MSTTRSVGGSNSARWRNPLLSREGRTALTAFGPEAVPETSSKFLGSHQDTEDLRFIAERYRRRQKGKSESTVNFELDQHSDSIVVKINDELTGDLKLRLSPEQVEQVLKSLEETEDNEASLSSFFIDIQI